MGTKATILECARERFAEDGYERATIRAIAAQADIDPAMVMRYFGNKEGLFSAVTEIDRQLPDLSATPVDRVGLTLAHHYLTRWEGDGPLMIMLRASVTHADVSERMRRLFASQVVPVASRVADDPATGPVRAGLVATQIIGVAVCRFVLALPPVVTMDRSELVGWIGPTLQRYLTGPLPSA
jgi:AcrR family transcriptional regulator